MKKQVNKTLSLLIVLSLLVSMFSGLIVSAATISNPSFITFSPSSFEEAIANDGSISNSPVTINITSGTIRSASRLTTYSTVTAPNGIVATLTYINSTSAQLSLSGKAVNNTSGVQNVAVRFNSGMLKDSNGNNRTDDYTFNVPINFYDAPNLTYNGNIFTEALANDGSFDATNPIAANIVGNPAVQFKTGNFVNGTDYSVANIPAGLTVVLTRVNSQKVNITLSGNATNHTYANDVNNATIIFNNSAFSTGGSTMQNKNFVFSIEFLNYPNLDFSSSSFTETDANNGSFDVNAPISVTILGTSAVKFKTGTFTRGTDFSTTNIPAGLNVTITRINDKEVAMKISGNATNHAQSNSINNASITFNAVAFSPNSVVLNNALTFGIQFIDIALSYVGNSFSEAAANDGAIDANSKIIASIDGSATLKFKTGTLIPSTDYTVVGLPTGLSAVVSSDNGSEAIITLSGKASAHLAANSVANATITFKSTAFSPASNNLTNLVQAFSVNFNDPGKITADTNAFVESDSNDGSIAGQRAILLTNASFVDVPFVSTTYYAITGVPAGLTAKVTRESANRLGLSFEGKATTHASINSANVTLTLKDAAFISGASQITGKIQNFQLNFADNTPIRVLEVYPSSVTSTGDGNFRDAVTQLTASNYVVTSITMNRFISIIDDVNGNYDVVYFGRGRYMKGSPSDSYFGNDITSKAAVKVLEFINSGQLCIFHTDALTSNTIISGLPTSIMQSKFNVAAVTGKANVKTVSGTNPALATTITNGLAASTTNRRPIMDMVENPYSYRALGTAFDSSTLKFTLRATDKESATLAAILYIDKNNDGLFSTTEAVDRHTVNKDMFDSFSYRMPNGLTGVYFWKLELKDASGAKDSFTDVFYLKGDEVQINVLQVIPTGNNLDLSVKLNDLVSGTTDKLGTKAGEYKINVTKVTIDSFNNPPANDTLGLMNLNGNYNMIILGFADEYGLADLDADASTRLQSFINTGQSVMFTHDTIEYSGYRSSNLLTNFRSVVGQTNQLTATQLVRNNSSDTVVTNFGLNNTATNNMYSKLMPNNPGAVLVKQVNSTALTLYPFNLEVIPQNSMSVANTHYQYYKLDLEDPTIIPVYNYYADVSGRLLDDSMNNYYTYSKGTITYSGTGHSNNYPEFELKLFVNTILKAYAGANHAPTLEVSQPLNNAKLDLNTSSVALSFRGYDYDFDDDILYYKVYLDNGSGTYVLQGSETQMNNGQTINLSIPKGFSDARTFKLKVELRDKPTAQNGAMTFTELTLYNTELPLLTPIITTDKTAYLVGESINATVTLQPSGKVTPNVTITPSTLKLTVPTGLGGATTNFTTVGGFIFGSTGPISAAYLANKAILAALPAGVALANYTLQAECNYSLYGASVQQLASKNITVKNGTVELWVKDDQGNPLKDVNVSDYAIATGMKTNAGGRYLFEGVSAGSHNYRIAMPKGYALDKVLVNKKGGAVITYTDPEAAILAMSATNSEWEVTYVLKFGTAIEVVYLNVRADKSLAAIPAPGGIYTLRVAKKSKVSIVAFFQIPDVESTNVNTVQLTMHTKLMDGTETYYTQDSDSAILTIPGSSTPVTLVASNPRIGGAITDKSKWATPGAIYMDLFNNNPTAGFTYAGATKWYYTVIVIEPTENQQFRIDKIKLVMDNGSLYAIPNSNAQLINIMELLPPVLR
ncbi:MAG: DUF5057 domain-containing protein [Clostridia bacterium]